MVRKQKRHTAARRVAVESLERRVVYSNPMIAPGTIGVFNPGGSVRASALTVPTIISTTPGNGVNGVALSVDLTITFSTAMLASSIDNSTIQLRDYTNALVPSVVTYDAATKTAKLNPTPTLALTNEFYYAKVIGGANGLKEAGGTALAADYAWSFSTGQPVFTETTVISGLVEPTAVKFSPDGRVFVAEKSGIIKVYSSLTDTTADVFIDLREEVHNYWDRGLLGLTLHPDFPNTPYVYALYTYDGDLGGPVSKFGNGTATSDPGPDLNGTGNGPQASCKLVRFTASGNFAVPGSAKTLVADWQQQFQSHSIGTVEFGPDGYLYVSAGDGASFGIIDSGQQGNPFNEPSQEGGAVRSQDLLSPNDPTTLDGSVIRIDPETGFAAPSNPLATSPDANARRIIAEGLRNPFRFTFRPGTNEVWIGDVGFNEYEEINRIVSTSDAVVENFGWPAYEGRIPNYGYQNANLPLLQQLYADPSRVTMPYLAYNHNSKVVAGSAEPIGGSSVTGLAFYNGGTYPSGYDGALFFADYSRSQIYVMYKGPNNLPVNGTQQVFKATAGGATQLMIGPGGDLFYVDLNNGKLQRFTYSGGQVNHAPSAVAIADKTSGAAPLTVQFSAASSADADAGDSLSYAWDLDADGDYDDSTAIAPSYTYSTTGTRVVGLRVTDRAGLTGTATVSINVGNTAPTIDFAAPLSTLKWAVGDTINFAATATDVQDGTLPASAFTWTLTLLHDNLADPSSSHQHHIQTYAGVRSGTFVAPDHEYPSRLQLTLTVTDSGGTTTTQTVVLAPQTTQLSFASVPAGLQVTVNGATYATPFVYTAIAGAATTISAATNQFLNGNNYAFATWSDTGARSHPITPKSNQSFTVNYTLLNPQGPYSGTPASVPGKVEAENFDTGGANVAYVDNSTGNEGGAYRPSEDVDIETTTDTGGGYNIGWITTGEATNYSIDVTAKGTYTIDTRLAAIATGGLFHIEIDGVNVTGSLTVPNTGGFQNWANVSKSGIVLTQGAHVMKFVADKVGAAGVLANINHFVLTASGGATTAPAAPANLIASSAYANAIALTWTDTADNEAGFKVERRKGTTGTWEQIALLGRNANAYSDTGLPASTTYYYRVRSSNEVADSAPSGEAMATTQAPPPRAPFGGTAEVMPGTIEVENFDSGGQGVTYNDLSDGNEGGQYRPPEEDVDIEASSDVGGGFNVGWFVASEWMEYTVSVPTGGTYTLDLRAASPGTGAKVNFFLDGTPWTGDITLPNTGGFQNWQTVSKTGLTLSAGTHTIRLTGAVNSDYGVVGNLNWFKLTSTSAPPPTGGGNGLAVTYFNNADLTGSTVGRVDPTVNFNWGNGSPAGAIDTDTFSARWTGQVLAEKNETYTFYTKSDDGARLWVNGELIIDRWRTQSDTEWSGTIALEAGKKYALKLEYFDDKYAASAALRWSSATTPKAIVPQANLFSSTGGVTASTLKVSAYSSTASSSLVRWTFSGHAFHVTAGPIRLIDLIRDF